MSWRRRALFALAPFVLLGVAEGGLRVAGFGRALEPVFVPSPHPAFLQPNPRALQRLHVDPAVAPPVAIETAYFRAQKPPGAFRVFVQGGSSAAGFPYGFGASVAGLLDQRLEREFPSREIEVVSTAVAAASSYALLDHADAILAQQPDAVLVYAGHDEYAGVHGVGSTRRVADTPRLTRLHLALRGSRLYQFVVLRTGLERRHSSAAPSRDGLLAGLVAESSIPLDSARFRAGEAQFRGNLERLLAKYRAAGVRVFVATPVSNEHDQVPLAVLAGVETSPAGAARMAFQTAQDAAGADKFDAARDGFAWARDLDPLRLRAPTVFGSLAAVAAQAQGAVLVPVRDRFVDASPDGLVGSRLFVDHVHPSVDGAFLLADAFHDALLEAGLPGVPEFAVTEAQARADVPVTELDRRLGELQVRALLAGWPFTSPADAPSAMPAPGTDAEQLAQAVWRGEVGWAQAQERLRARLREQGNDVEYARSSALLADAFPFAVQSQFEAAAALVQVERPADAWRYASRALAFAPRNVDALLVGAHASLLAGERERGRALLERVLEIEPNHEAARRVLELELEHAPAP